MISQIDIGTHGLNSAAILGVIFSINSMLGSDESGAGISLIASTIAFGILLCAGIKGLTFLYSDLCPYTADWVDEMIAVAEKYDLPCEKIKIEGL
ncbi:MAG: hypothetical protein SVY15_09120, partial [Halobacteriota archaeon]|nr:hypothetical protein [Halobacteriota archaeon]